VYPSAGGDGSCGFERLEIDGRAYIRYSRNFRINPNDAQANRGAYLSAGFLAGRVLTTHQASSCIDLVAQICGHLKGLVGPDNRVAPGFELTDYAFGGQRLEDLIDDGCSPLLQLDVLLQAINAAGSLSFKPSRPIFLEPAPRAEAGEIDRRLFYFDSGAAGSKLELDREREKLKRLTEKLVVAASYADQVQDEWLAYQAMIEEHLPSVATRGSELRVLIDEAERLAGSLDKIGATAVDVPAVKAAGRAASGRADPYVGAVPQRYRSAGTLAHRAERRRGSHGPRRSNPAPSFRVAVGVGGAVVLAVAVIVAVQLFVFGPESAPGGSEVRADSAAGLASPAEGVTRPAQPVAGRAEGDRRPVEEAMDSAEGATDPAEGAADSAEGAAVAAQGAAVTVQGVGSPAAAPAEDARSDVVRERAALGQRTPE
jgi:hypothetical protein